MHDRGPYSDRSLTLSAARVPRRARPRLSAAARAALISEARLERQIQNSLHLRVRAEEEAEKEPNATRLPDDCRPEPEAWGDIRLMAIDEIEVLQNLCPDNMRGSICLTPDACSRMGFYFACPDYAFCRPCYHTVDHRLAHRGYRHTIIGCQVDNNVDCKKRHDDGRPCRVPTIYYHVRASCESLRTGKQCEAGKACRWGHDYVEVRKSVMFTRREFQRLLNLPIVSY